MSGMIFGLPELSANLKRIAKMIDEEAVEKGLLSIGGELRNRVRDRAPIGKTGNLKKSIVVKKFRNKIKEKPAVFVAVNFKKAFYPPFVEYGHGGTHPAPPHPFFRPAVDEFKTVYPIEVETMLRGLFNDWVTPGNANINAFEPSFSQVAESM